MLGQYQPGSSDSSGVARTLCGLDTPANPTRSDSKAGLPEVNTTRGTGLRLFPSTASAGHSPCACGCPHPSPSDLAGAVSIRLLTAPSDIPSPLPALPDDDNSPWPDDHEIEFDLTQQTEQRFDEESEVEWERAKVSPPIQLERRGASSHRQQSGSRATHTPWQDEFWARQTVFKTSVAAKLREVGQDALAMTLDACHTEWTVQICNDCSKSRRFPNRCDLSFCPECQPRLASERKKAVEWWTKLIKQPKHMVLTLKNTRNITTGHLSELKRWFARLRRRQFARCWRGGFWSIEVTNEGSGWHLHMHILVDADWIDEGELAKQWADVTGRIGRIVKVKDARQKNYLAEVTKYAVKGSQLAQWTPEQIEQFVLAFGRQKTFGVFGDLHAARTKFSEWIADLQNSKPKCECGSNNVRYMDECDFLAQPPAKKSASSPRPPPFKDPQQELVTDDPRCWSRFGAV